MRYIISRVALFAAALIVVALPVLADEDAGTKLMAPAEAGKDQCLLVAKNCDQVGTVQGRIDIIKREINRGTAVYTDEELRELNMKLNDTIQEMNDAYKGGA